LPKLRNADPELKIRLRRNVKEYYCAKFQVIATRGFCFVMLTYNMHTYIPTDPLTHIHTSWQSDRYILAAVLRRRRGWWKGSGTTTAGLQRQKYLGLRPNQIAEWGSTDSWLGKRFRRGHLMTVGRLRFICIACSSIDKQGHASLATHQSDSEGLRSDWYVAVSLCLWSWVSFVSLSFISSSSSSKVQSSTVEYNALVAYGHVTWLLLRFPTTSSSHYYNYNNYFGLGIYIPDERKK